MSVLLHVSHPDWDDEDLQSLTDELFQAIEAETDISAKLASSEAPAGTKAVEIIETGLIVLGGAGSVASLVPVFSAFFNRNPALKLHIKNDNKEVKITGKNLTTKQIQKILSNLPFDDDD